MPATSANSFTNHRKRFSNRENPFNLDFNLKSLKSLNAVNGKFSNRQNYNAVRKRVGFNYFSLSPLTVSNIMDKNKPSEEFSHLLHHDLSAEKRLTVEQPLAAGQDAYYTLIEHAPVIIVELGKDGIIKFVNFKALKESGYEKEDLVGKHFLEADLFIGEDRERLVSALNDTLEGREVKKLIVRFMAKNKTIIYLEINAIPLEKHLLIAMANITESTLAAEKLRKAHDELEQRVEKRTRQLEIKNEELNQEIIERKNIEEELIASRQRLRLVIDNIPQFIFWKDLNSVYMGCNKNFAEAAGLSSPKEIIGKTDFQLDWNRADAEHFIARDKKIMNQDKPEFHTVESRFREDGTQKWLDINLVPLHNLNDEVIGVLGAYEDISERLLARKEAELREQKLVQADKMISLGILASGIAHEINNPNQFIMSHLIPLKKACEGALPILERYSQEYGEFRLAGMNFSQIKHKLPGIFNNVMEGSQRIKNIVTELRKFILEHPSEHTETIQFNNVVQSSLTLLSNLIKKSTLSFSVSYDETLPFIMGHYQQLEQVVINLVQNACQSLTSRDESIHVKTGYNGENKTISLAVSDQGIGIPEKHKDRVTDLFFTTKRDIGGIGLGLAISSKIVMEHGGKLSFTSNLTKGTLVQVDLPIERDDVTTKTSTILNTGI